MLAPALQLHSASFARSRFALHGKASVRVQGRVLRVDATGPFNLESVQAVCCMLDGAAPALPKDRCFIELIALHNSLLMPPEAFGLLRAFTAKSLRAGYRPLAMLLYVAPDAEGRDLLMPRLLALWNRSRPVQVFDRLADAEDELQRRLLRASQTLGAGFG